MPLRSSRSALVVPVVIVAVLTGCGPSAPPPAEPQGPVAPTSSTITLERLASVVSADDAPPQALFDVGAASTAGADLLSEQEYWISVGGTPDECADVVSSPYLVSSADDGDAARADDPTGAIGSFTEQEDLFGLVQVYGRVFDDEAAAAGFLDAFSSTVAACGGYRLVGPDGVTGYEATALRVVESDSAPASTRVLIYSEDVTGGDILSLGTIFAQHRNAVVAIYSELYPSSTMTPADVEGIAATVTGRLAAL